MLFFFVLLRVFFYLCFTVSLFSLHLIPRFFSLYRTSCLSFFLLVSPCIFSLYLPSCLFPLCFTSYLFFLSSLVSFFSLSYLVSFFSLTAYLFFSVSSLVSFSSLSLTSCLLFLSVFLFVVYFKIIFSLIKWILFFFFNTLTKTLVWKARWEVHKDAVCSTKNPKSRTQQISSCTATCLSSHKLSK